MAMPSSAPSSRAPRWRFRSCSRSWCTSCGPAPALPSTSSGSTSSPPAPGIPVAEQFGAFPLIFGTLLSSVVALIIAVPLSLGVAIYLVEFAPKAARQPVAFLISLLAAIPSVVYGLWGIFVLIPLLTKQCLPVPP